MKKMDIDEKELVRRAREGDNEAFEFIMSRYQERIMRILMPILKNTMDVEEVTQDVFMTIFGKIEQFRHVSSLGTWIHRIAINAALMRRRRQKRVELGLDEALPAFEERGYADADAKDWSETLDDPVLRQEGRAVISRAVDQLNDKYKAVFVLREMESFSTSETAAALGLSTAAVKTRLHRARLFLRDALTSYFTESQHTPALYTA